MITSFELESGLGVILAENHTSPVVAFQAWVRVGAADEPEDLAGIAHVFEHMLFKGTARRGVGQIAKEVESSGGSINAWTSFDETVFHLVLSSRYFDAGLDLLTDALRNPAFDPVELERELQVILEEVKQGEDAPGRVASHQLFSTAYEVHPYGRPVIGSVNTVKRLTRADVLAFYQRHYLPSNITLVVVGDFDTAQAQDKISALWHDFQPPAAAPRSPRTPEPRQSTARARVRNADVRELHLGIGFHVPGLVHEHTGALDVAAIVLGQGESSRLNRYVRRERQLVSDIYAYSYSPREPGLFVVSATLPPRTLAEACDAVIEQICALVRDEVSIDELAKAKTIVESDAIYQQETVQGLARKLGYFRCVTGSLGYEEEHQQQVRALTPHRLREVLSRYFCPANATISLLGPSDTVVPGQEAALESDLRQRLVAAFARSAEPAVPIRAARAMRDEVVREVLPTGTRLLVFRDSSVPLVAMRAVWQGGLRTETTACNGVSNLIAGLLTRGTHTRSAERLAREVESMAGALGGFAGRNSAGMRAELISRHFEQGMDIVLDCLLHPSFGPEELEHERRQALEELRTQNDNVSAVAFRLFTETLYPHHPYRLNLLGNPTAVAALGRIDLCEHHRRHYPPSGLTLAIVGDVEPRQVIDQLRRTLTGVAELPEPAPASPVPDPPPSSPRHAERILNRQQAHLVLGFAGATLGTRDRYSLEVLASVLSGQGGRLFAELRDKRALAYLVSALSVEGIDPGYFAIHLATSPTNLDLCRTLIEHELDRMRTTLVPVTELDRVKRYLAGAHDISLQRRSALASALAFGECYGLGWDAYRRYASSILQVTAEDVRQVACRYLAPECAVSALVRPELPSDASAAA